MLVLMSLSASSFAQITISGNISLANVAPVGGVSVEVVAGDDSVNGYAGSFQAINFAQGESMKPFSFTVASELDASWLVEVVCTAGCSNYMDLMSYSPGEPGNSTLEWDLITFLPGGSNLPGIDFSLAGAKTIDGNLGFPNSAPSGGMIIHMNALNLNRVKPDGWYYAAGSQSLSVPGNASSVSYSMKVIDDGASSLIVQAYCPQWENVSNQCYGYSEAAFYAGLGSTAIAEQALPLVGGASHSNIDIDMIDAQHVAGTISLPSGVASGDIEIFMAVRGKTSNSNSDGTQTVIILDGTSSVGYDVKTDLNPPSDNWIVRAQCEVNCDAYLNRSYYNDLIGQTAVKEQATVIDNTQSHSGINFSLVAKYSGALPMCNVLLDDFSGMSVDLDDWDMPETSAQLSGGKLLLSQKLISRADKMTAAQNQRFGVNLSSKPNKFGAMVSVTEADLTSSGTGQAFASLRGGYYYTLGGGDTPDGQLGLVWAGLYIGDRGAGIEAWWEILESTDPEFSSYTVHAEGTLIAPGTLLLNTAYPIELEYLPGTSSFTFTLNGVSASANGPAKGTQSGPDTWRRLVAGAVPDANQDDDPIAARVSFDDVTADDLAYDDFAAASLDGAKWDGLIAKRTLTGGKLQVELISNSSDRQTVRSQPASKYLVDATCLQGSVSIATGSVIPPGTRARNRLDGYWYNALHDEGSYDGFDGMVWSHIAFEQVEDGTLRAGAYVERAIGADYNSVEQLGFYQFETPVSFDTDYTMAIELDEPNKQLLFRFEDEVWVLPIMTNIYPVESSYAYKGFTVRTQSGPGELHASIDNVRVTPASADVIADFSVSENAGDTLLDLTGILNKAGTTYSVISNSGASLVGASIAGAELTLQYATNQNGSADIVIRAISGGRTVDEPFTVLVTQGGTPPTVVDPIADFSVDEDASDTELDLSAVFEDADSASIALSIFDNSEPGLVSTSLTGTSSTMLLLSYAPDQSGQATITIRATADGQSVDEDFIVTVNPVDDAPTVVGSTSDINVDEDAPSGVPIDLSAIFADIDSALVFSVATSNSGLVSASVSGADLSLNYLPDQFGQASITVRATSNGKFVEDAFDITVNPVDDAPTVVNAISDFSVDEDATDVVLDLSAVFSDIDSASMVFNVEANSDSDLVNASVTGTSTSLLLHYAPDQFGQATIKVRATADTKTVDDEFVVTVNPVDDSPTVANAILDVAVDEDAADTVFSVGAVFADIDSQDIELSIVDNTHSGLLSANLEGTNLRLAYLPDQYGNANIIIRGTADGKWVDAPFTVTVASINDLPVFTSPGILKFSNGEKAVGTVSASDVEGDPVTFMLNGGVDDALFELSTAGVLKFLVAPDSKIPGDDDGNNEYEIIVQAYDGIDTVDQNITITERDECQFFVVRKAIICL